MQKTLTPQHPSEDQQFAGNAEEVGTSLSSVNVHRRIPPPITVPNIMVLTVYLVGKHG